MKQYLGSEEEITLNLGDMIQEEIEKNRSEKESIGEEE